MSTADSVILIIAASLLSLFFLVLIGLIIYVWVTYRRIVKKAEDTLDSVEAASHMIKEVGSKTNANTAFKIIKFIVNLSRKG